MEREVVRERVLHGDRRLVTLTGAAGTGKTTLALEVARQVEPLMPDGAWFVDLTVVREPDAIPLAVAGALGVIDQGRPPLEALADHLAARQTLVVLDNGEHLLPALGAIVDALLDRAPDLRILATSRAALRVQDESIHVVPPFAIPGPDVADPARLAEVEAVQLFVERATAVDPAFALNRTNAPAVASICRRLDGLPLAIELAAASASTLAPAEIDQRLATIGGLDASRGGHGPERQRTMDATLEWSHELLDPGAQTLFRRLAVFSGGWSLAAAERVGSLGTDGGSVVPHLAELVDHSLVIRDEDGDRSRYRMLAPIAEYAMRRLDTSGELGAAAMAHATTYLTLSTSPYADRGQCLPEDIDRVAAEHANGLAAIRFAEGAGILPLRLRLILNHVPLWRVHGHLHLAVRHLESALASTGDGSYEQAAVQGVLAEFEQVLGDYDAADAYARAAETTFQGLGDPAGERVMIGLQGLAAAGRGDFEGARAAFQRARPLLDTNPSAVTLAYWEAGAGRFELGLGNLEAAETHLVAADGHFRATPSWYHGRVLAMLAVIARRRGDPRRAAELFAAGLATLRAYGATVEVIDCLEDMARLAIDQGDPGRAAVLLGASTGLRDATASARSVPDHEQRNADIDGVRTTLPATEFEAAWSLGLAMTLAEAVDFATTTRTERVAGAHGVPRGSALTPREREIAELVALGLSNREIADRLVIAPGTVKIHVERILGKLGRTSRVQIATWAVEERDAAASGT